ncbi:MAG: GNAT family N-acetyltransferase [Bacteroidia bacterium]
MKILKATISHLEELSCLFDAYRVFYRKESDVFSANEFLRERLNNGDSEIFVSENTNGQLTGFVQLYPLFSSTKMRKLWLLNDLFVAEDQRGKGYSVALIEKAKELVKNSKACGMFLETEKSNIIGNHLYPKVGFIPNEVSNYYEWNCDL